MPPSPLRSYQSNPSSGGRGTDGRPMKILFVEEMTEIMGDTFPDLWKLGKAYFSGTLFQGVLLTEKQQQLARNCGVNQPRFEVSTESLRPVPALPTSHILHPHTAHPSHFTHPHTDHDP